MPKPKATPDKPRAAAAPGSTSPTSEKPMTIAPGRPGDIGGLVSVKIDDIELKVPFGTTILEAAKTVGIRVPTLCYHRTCASPASAASASSRYRSSARCRPPARFPSPSR